MADPGMPMAPGNRVSLAVLESRGDPTAPARAESCQSSVDSGQVLGMVPGRGLTAFGQQVSHHGSLPLLSCRGLKRRAAPRAPAQPRQPGPQHSRRCPGPPREVARTSHLRQALPEPQLAPQPSKAAHRSYHLSCTSLLPRVCGCACTQTCQHSCFLPVP